MEVCWKLVDLLVLRRGGVVVDLQKDLWALKLDGVAALPHEYVEVLEQQLMLSWLRVHLDIAVEPNRRDLLAVELDPDSVEAHRVALGQCHENCDLRS